MLFNLMSPVECPSRQGKFIKTEKNIIHASIVFRLAMNRCSVKSLFESFEFKIDLIVHVF